MWSQLPELILTQILGLLGNSDRVNAAQVCQHWHRTLASPCLWRRCVVHIDRDLGLDHSLAAELAKRFGEHMRSLELVWTRPYYQQQQQRDRPPRLARCMQAEAGADYLASVRAKEVRLQEVKLTDWIHSSKWGNCGKLLCSLVNLLACQHNLERFSMMNANLGQTDALRLLRIIAKVSGTRLSSLDIRGAFRESQAPHSNPRYLKVLGRMQALIHLSLDYSAVSDGALIALASGNLKTLQTMHISVRDSGSRLHSVEDSSWHSLVEACPQLTISIIIFNVEHYEDMCNLLLPSVPLAKFQMIGNHVWDQSRSRNFRSTISLIISHYSNTLEEFILQVRNNREMLDDLIISMLIRCKNLKKLQYDGIMRSLETIRDICQMQVDYKMYFRTVHVTPPKNVNVRNRALLHDISSEFERRMTDQGIDFRIDSPA
ncbi:hypothetical protein QAD02_010886 [Eretmocerus hayati]|uniref:Uncharacterized protein n=1 Tax=Eretmocerus hayati TaxID=131215 RepID=A0ACC2NV41_9HYME|nr:hypothetical protein QAD02_010886 [Eretmocerus hayati]